MPPASTANVSPAPVLPASSVSAGDHPRFSEVRTPDFGENLPGTHAQFFCRKRRSWQMPTTTIPHGRTVRVAQGGWRTGNDELVRTA